MTDSSDVSTLIAQIELARTRRLDPAHPDTEAIRSTSLKALDPTRPPADPPSARHPHANRVAKITQ